MDTENDCWMPACDWAMIDAIPLRNLDVGGIDEQNGNSTLLQHLILKKFGHLDFENTQEKMNRD
jgi:hypothetical protein